MTRGMRDRRVWQNALDDIIAFTKTPRGKRTYNWRKLSIERSFAETKVVYGMCCARMLGIPNMR